MRDDLDLEEGGDRPSGAETELLLEIARELVSEESRRDEALNSRAVAIVAFGAVALALAAGLERGLPLHAWDPGWRYPGLVLALVGVLALAGAVVLAVWGVLRPRRFAMLSRVEVKKFLTPEYLDRSDMLNRQVLLMGMVEILDQERTRIGAKAAALARAYLLVLIATTSIAALALLSALNASGIIGVTHGEEKQARESSLGRTGRSEATAAGRRTDGSSAAPRVRREGSERSRP